MQISVIVCTCNRAHYLARMLDSFYAQSDLAVAHELLLINNRSTDSTQAVAESYRGRAGFRYVEELQQGLGYARNRGVAEARGEILAFLDDDVLVTPLWLRHLLRCFVETDADVVGGRAYLVFEAPLPPWFGPGFRLALSEVELGDQRRQLPDGRRLCGVNLAFRRSRMDAAGGFRGELGRCGAKLLAGEETELLARVAAGGGRLVYDPDAAVGHLVGPERLTWDYFRRQARGAGETAVMLECANDTRPACWQLTRAGLVLCRHCLLALPALFSGAYSRRHRYRLLIKTWVRFAGHWRRWRGDVRHGLG